MLREPKSEGWHRRIQAASQGGYCSLGGYDSQSPPAGTGVLNDALASCEVIASKWHLIDGDRHLLAPVYTGRFGARLSLGGYDSPPAKKI
ncbi:MAG: hypothetical protein EBE86_011605 [Hormoscilla sp. GUM202]|nr:hypothetical protein [Hormoscilla sp. GUM202]